MFGNSELLNITVISFLSAFACLCFNMGWVYFSLLVLFLLFAFMIMLYLGELDGFPEDSAERIIIGLSFCVMGILGAVALWLVSCMARLHSGCPFENGNYRNAI